MQLIQSYQDTTAELEEARRLNGELRLASQVSLLGGGTRCNNEPGLQAQRPTAHDGGVSRGE